MNGTETEESNSLWWDSHISPKNAKWLAENLEEVDQSVKAMRKLIEEDGDSYADNAGTCSERRGEFSANIEGFYRLYRLLAERYDHLTGALRKHVPSLVHSQDSAISHSSSAQDSPSVTPAKMLGRNKFEQQPVGFDLSLSSDGSSDLSLKEGSESSSLASDSESESFDSSINKHSDQHVSGDGKGPHQKIVLQENGFPGVKDVKVVEKEIAADEVEEQGIDDYAALLKRTAECEQQLKVSNKKLQLREEEVGRLKTQLETAWRDIKMREVDIDMEKKRVSELEKEVAKLEAQVSDSNLTIGTLVEELEIARDKLKELDCAFSNAQKTFSLDKAKLKYDITVLSEQLALSEARVEESELRSKSTENKILQCEAEKTEMKCLHEAQQIDFCNEIERVKTDVAVRIEALSKKLDILKPKYDMLVAEKDGVNAKVQMLTAEMTSKDNQIQQLEENLRQLHVESVELISGHESAKELVDKLRVRVGELEKEVDRQRILILDGAEKKREVIRQLCFSLEHYRTGYKELLQAFVGHKHRAFWLPRISKS